MHRKIVIFLSLDKTKLVIFLVFSLVAMMFFALPAAFLILALPVGGLYYFFLLQVFQSSSQLLGLDYYPTLGDAAFSITLATTAIGYFYLLSSYITVAARRTKQDLAGMLMILSIILIFVSPFIILSYQSAALENIGVKYYHIVDGESCVNVPVTGEAMEWDQERRTCYLLGNFIVGHHGNLEIADDVTLEILAGGNLTTTVAMNNNGTLVVNGGTLKNSWTGYIFNTGVIDHRNGLFINNGNIENGRYFDGNEVVTSELPIPSLIVNRATLENNYYISNHENFTNLGLVDNDGQIMFIGESKTFNAGIISNKGRIEIAGEFDNESEILNSGMIVIYRYSEPITESRTVLNNFGELINTVGEIHNLSIINNYGSILNELGRFVNSWYDDKAVINNEGVISNTGEGQFLNEGIITNSCSGVIDGEIQNSLPAELCDR